MKKALAKKDSIFYTYKQLIELRKNNELIVWGDYQLVTDTPDDVFAYYRTLNNEQWLVVCNMSEKNQPYTLADQAMTLVTVIIGKSVNLCARFKTPILLTNKPSGFNLLRL